MMICIFRILVMLLLVFKVGVSTAFGAEPGLTDSEIVIGAHELESGAHSDKKAITLGYFFDDINAAGGVNGRKIKFIHYDGGFVVSRVVEAVHKLVEEDKIFAMVGANPPTGHQSVWRYLVEKGVPDLFFIDGVKVYQEPFQRNEFPVLPKFYDEGATMGKIVAEKAKGKKICFIQLNAESTIQFLDGAKTAIAEFNKGLKPSDANQKVTLGSTQVVDRVAPNSNAQILALKRESCDSVIDTNLSDTFAKDVNFAYEQDFKPLWATWSFNCRPDMFALIKREARDGILTNEVVQRFSMGPNDVAWKKVESFAERHNLKDDIANIPTALEMGELFVEALKRAGRDVTREKLLSAAESLTGFKCSVCLLPSAISSTNHWPVKKVKVFVWKNDKLNELD